MSTSVNDHTGAASVAAANGAANGAIILDLARSLAGGVQRDYDGFHVPDARTPKTVFRVWRDESGRARCTCTGYEEQCRRDPRYRCEHILAVKLHLEPPPADITAPAVAPAAASAELVVSTEECSTNLYFTMAAQDHPEEIFNLQFTVRGNPSRAKLEAHIAAVRAACGLICSLGGQAKQVGQQPGPATAPAASKPADPWEFFTGEKGKTFIRLPDGMAEPNEISCPIHSKKMKRHINEDGSWYSHKDGQKWCSVAVPSKE